MPSIPLPRLAIFTAVCAFCLPAVSAENWARYRGPNGSGIASDSSAPLSWSETENLKWSLDLPGPGSSSPIVWGDRVYVTCYSGYGDGSGGEMTDLKRHLIAVDRASGSIIWEKSVATTAIEDPYEGFITEHGYASQTPVTDGKHIYCFFGKTGVVAFDWDGNEVWRREVGSGSSRKRWGSASSPILLDDLLVVNASDESETLFGIDAATGEVRWQSEAASLNSIYGTPILHKVSGDRTDIVITVLDEIWGVNPESGNLRWFASNGIAGNASASVVGDPESGILVAFGGFPRTLAVGVRGGGKGDVTATHNLWENKNAAYLNSPVFHEGKLYWVSDKGIAYCSDPESGELIYEERLPDTSGKTGKGKPFYASPVLVNGHLLAVSRTAGTFVIEAKPEFNLVRVNKIAGDESQFNAAPAVSGKLIFIRSQTTLYAIGEP